MLPAFFDHLWQSTLFALVAGLLTLVLRENRARVRHWVWAAASFKFLFPLSVLIGIGSQMEWRTLQAPSKVPAVMVEVSEPFTAQSSLIAAAPAAHGNALPGRIVRRMGMRMRWNQYFLAGPLAAGQRCCSCRYASPASDSDSGNLLADLVGTGRLWSAAARADASHRDFRAIDARAAKRRSGT
jgi:hypothetical protein